MKLPDWSITHSPIVYTAVALLMLWGIFSFLTMPRREDPEYTIRTCVISTSWPGTPVTKVEELITDKLEEAVDSIEEVDVVRSTTTVGLSTIYVDLDDSTPADVIQNVWDKVRARIDKVPMPEEGLKPIVNDEFGDTAVLLLAIHQIPLNGAEQIDDQNRYSFRELEDFADLVKDELRLLDGAAKVEKFGVRDEAIYIETDLANWSQLGLTTNELSSLVSSRNIVETGGAIDTPDTRYSVFPSGEFNAVAELESIIADYVSSGPSRTPVYLTDLNLAVKRSYQDPPGLICRYGDVNGTYDAVMLGLTMKSGSNIVDLCNLAKARIQQMQEVEQILPPDLAVTPVSDQSLNVSAKISDVIVNVIEAVLIVVLVVLLMVGLRTSVVMAANIPIVVLASIGMITLFGVQLEQISLASIIIALGLLVDNAVQVCDQSRTNQIEGAAPIPATVAGANTLAIPMLTGTLTTVAAFLPMLFALEGGGKEYVYSLPVTLSVTLGLSWILAMSFCVLLASSSIRAPKDPEKPTAPLQRIAVLFSPKNAEGKMINPAFQIYEGMAWTVLKGKYLTVLLSGVLFVLAVRLPVASEFFPKDRRDQFAVKIWLPESASIEATNQITRQVEQIIRELSPTTDANGQSIQRLRAMRSMIGGGGSRWYLGWNPEARAANFAEILIRTTDGELTANYAEQVRQVAEQGHEQLGLQPVVGARVVPIQLALGPPADPVVIRLSGPGFADLSQMQSVATELTSLLKTEPETWDINDSWGAATYQVSVDIDEERSKLAGVSNSQIAQILNAYYSGQKLTTFREGDHQIPIYFRLRQNLRDDLSGLTAAHVEGASGKIPISSVASFSTHRVPAKIERRDMNRTIEIRSQVETGAMGNEIVKRILGSAEVAGILEKLPPGYRIEAGGALEESQDASVQMLTSFSMSILLITLLLVIQYNGIIKPIIILTTLPLALIGALPGLYFTGNPIGFMPQLGILSLFGIVLNTGIIFIEFADTLIQDRMSKSSGVGPIGGLTVPELRQCLIDAGKLRMLPIFLTTATTVGGLLPLALAGGPLWEGMAWCMIYGLLVATLLTLFVVPALYAIVIELAKRPL